MNNIIRGLIKEVRDDGTAKVAIILQEESPNGLPSQVLIRCDHHHSPVLGKGRYGVDFGEKSQPRRPNLYDHVLLRRHRDRPGLAWAWCYEDEPVIMRPVVQLPIETKKTPYSEKVRRRRQEESAVA